MLSASLGTGRLLARPGERRVWVLDGTGAALWDLHIAGWGLADLAGLVAERFGLTPGAAEAAVMAHRDRWQREGLLGGDGPPAWPLGGPDEPRWPAPHPRPRPPGARSLRVADRRVGLRVADADLGGTLRGWLAPAGGALPIDHALSLEGPPDAWCLTLEGEVRATGQSRDGALVAVLAALTELGSRPAERLLVVHGAGLVQPDGRGLLLVAPGGAGKSTLATVLDAAGYGLLSDDVVPVSPDGDLLGLGLPLCLKPGSWPVLAARRPELTATPVAARLGRRVRFLAPRTPAPADPVTPARLVLCRWRPERSLQAESLTPAGALQGLVEAAAVVRDLTQAKLGALARWIEGLPAWRLTYPDLDQARAWLERTATTP